jgi:hypothetical protein
VPQFKKRSHRKCLDKYLAALVTATPI